MNSKDTNNEAPPPGERWLTMLPYAVAGVLFLPVGLWLFQQTRASEQLLHALAVLGLCGLYLWLENRGQLRTSFIHDRISILLLLAAFGCVLINIWLPHPLWLLAGFFCLLASLVRYCLGPQAARLANALLAACFMFIALVIVLPVFDWPLRYLAGSWSGSLLSALGHGIQLVMVTQPELHLRLYVDHYPFLVAAECNGFGVLSASLLVTILFSIYYRTGFFDGLLLVFAAIVIAFVANVFRIVTIVTLAPHVERYMLMHEIVGITFFYAALGLLLWIIVGFRRESGSKSTQAN